MKQSTNSSLFSITNPGKQSENAWVDGLSKKSSREICKEIESWDVPTCEKKLEILSTRYTNKATDIYNAVFDFFVDHIKEGEAFEGAFFRKYNKRKDNSEVKYLYKYCLILNFLKRYFSNEEKELGSSSENTLLVFTQATNTAKPRIKTSFLPPEALGKIDRMLGNISVFFESVTNNEKRFLTFLRDTRPDEALQSTERDFINILVFGLGFTDYSKVQSHINTLIKLINKTMDKGGDQSQSPLLTYLYLLSNYYIHKEAVKVSIASVEPASPTAQDIANIRRSQSGWAIIAEESLSQMITSCRASIMSQLQELSVEQKSTKRDSVLPPKKYEEKVYKYILYSFIDSNDFADFIIEIFKKDQQFLQLIRSLSDLEFWLSFAVGGVKVSRAQKQKNSPQSQQLVNPIKPHNLRYGKEILTLVLKKTKKSEPRLTIFHQMIYAIKVMWWPQSNWPKKLTELNTVIFDFIKKVAQCKQLGEYNSIKGEQLREHFFYTVSAICEYRMENKNQFPRYTGEGLVFYLKSLIDLLEVIQNNFVDNIFKKIKNLEKEEKKMGSSSLVMRPVAATPHKWKKFSTNDEKERYLLALFYKKMGPDFWNERGLYVDSQTCASPRKKLIEMFYILDKENPETAIQKAIKEIITEYCNDVQKYDQQLKVICDHIDEFHMPPELVREFQYCFDNVFGKSHERIKRYFSHRFEWANGWWRYRKVKNYLAIALMVLIFVFGVQELSWSIVSLTIGSLFFVLFSINLLTLFAPKASTISLVLIGIALLMVVCSAIPAAMAYLHINPLFFLLGSLVMIVIAEVLYFIDDQKTALIAHKNLGLDDFVVGSEHLREMGEPAPAPKSEYHAPKSPSKNVEDELDDNPLKI